MKKVLFTVFVILTTFNCIQSQNINNTPLSDTLPNLAKRYKTGVDELRRYVALNIRYPLNSMKNKTVGLSVSSVTISPEGDICKIEILNSIDNEIDREIKRVLKKTKGNWTKVDSIKENETFYLQVVFMINNLSYNVEIKEASNIMKYVTVNSCFNWGDNSFMSDAILEESLSNALKEKDYKTSINVLNEFVRRNPYNTRVYQLRMQCNSKLRNYTDVAIDSKKVSCFINNQPL